MKVRIPKYIIDNVIDSIDIACNWVVVIYVLIFASVLITEKRIVDLKPIYDIIALVGLAGVIFIPSKQQREHKE